MVDTGVLMLMTTFTVLVMVIIRCWYNRRDNSCQRETCDTTRKEAVTQEPPGGAQAPARHNRGPRPEQEWRRQDAERRRRLEAEVQKISHLFNDDTSEEDSAPEQFKLPIRPNRLESSSSSTDQSQILESTPPCRPCRKQTHRHREQQGGGEGSMVVNVCRTPGWIQLQGPLAHTTDNIIFMKIDDELEYHQNTNPSLNMYMYLDKKFELSRREDMAVMSLIQGTLAAQWLTGDTQQALTRSKKLLRDIHTYHLKYPAIAESQLYWQMYIYYMDKGKPGKAHSAMQAAVSCIQHHAPSTWTSHVCGLQGDMYDRLAQVSPGHRSRYQDLAVRCYTQARGHHLSQPCQEVEDLYLPLYYTLDTVMIKLEMPTLRTIDEFSESDIVHQRLSECVVSQCQVTEAQDLVTSVTPHFSKVTARYRAIIDERGLICRLIMNIRFTQLAMHDKAHQSAMSFMNTAQDLYEEWCDHASGYTNLRFDRLPHLPRDIVKTLDTLSSHLRLSSPPTPPPEPLSDSVSSEPSSAPPSGLKQLTEESRRAEKQAQRDAHKFSYSSGDVYSDRGVDVNSDVN